MYTHLDIFVPFPLNSNQHNEQSYLETMSIPKMESEIWENIIQEHEM